MSSNSLYIGRVFGIPICVHPSWLAVFALVTISLAESYFPQTHPAWPESLYWTLGTATSLLFFASILLHELAHSLIARRQGLQVHDIVLFIFGGVTEIGREPQTPANELLMAIAGPLTSVALGAGCIGLWFPMRGLDWPAGAMLAYVGAINLSVGLFNLLPGFPLDGGRVLRAVLWWRSRSLPWSTRWASRIGQLVAFLFITAGAWEAMVGSLLEGLWLAFIGLFLGRAAVGSYRQFQLQALLAQHTVGEIMSRDCPAVSPASSLLEIVDQHMLRGERGGLPVMESGSLLGLLTLERVKGFPPGEWGRRTAREAMIPMASLHPVGAAERLDVALSHMSEGHVLELPVLEEGQLVGLLTRENLLAFLDIQPEAQSRPALKPS